MTKPRDFSHLSVRDLIEARDMFHAHLINKRNVVATAIGRYLIRTDDFDETGRFRRKPGRREARTLENSVIVDISWPCILVFVKEWEDDETLLRGNLNGTDLVPKSVFMPDGRVVPICTVLAPLDHGPQPDVDIDLLRFPENRIGGGYPLIIASQGADRVASVGCVVSDGHTFYALTNKHVAGEAGEIVYSRIGGDRQPIGFTSGISLGRKAFDQLYPGWVCQSTMVNCDVGLVEIDDVHRWKTDIFVLGAFDEIHDLNTFNFDLSLIAEHELKLGEKNTVSGKVHAYGAVSGRLEGEILALFYRYKSVGGTEYVSDFLISGPGGRGLATHHGDSGTLWLVERPSDDPDKGPTRHPIALHWGQHDFVGGGESVRARSSYGLATCLSNVCRELEVDLVRGWNVDSPYTWGKVGHYTVAARAIQALSNGDSSLSNLMKANIPNITFANDKINAGLDTKGNPDLPKDPGQGMCPLADVPDIIWKQSKKTAAWGRKGDENPNHFADADAPSTGGKTLFEICDTKAKLTVPVWTKYYDGIDTKALKMDTPVTHGLISFRVWQIFDYMVAALGDKRADKFVFAAGVLAHYVGDACQPLHGSFMADGDPRDNKTVDYTAQRSSSKHQKGDVYPKTLNPGSGVHVAYEDHMIDDRIDAIWPALPKDAVNHMQGDEAIDPITDGQGAGFATLMLMKKTQATIHPKDIVELYKKAKGDQDLLKQLGDEFEDRTVTIMARGANYLAAIWTAAWQQGNGADKIADLGKVDPKKLIKLYKDPNELPSMHLDTIGPLLNGGNGAGGGGGAKKPKKPKNPAKPKKK